MKKPSIQEASDEFLAANGPAAIVAEEYLRPVEGYGSIIYPPTYLGKDGESTYNIDDTPNGKVAIIDSIPAQANRVEPLFLKSPHDVLVPQITIKAGEEYRNLLVIGHRAADAFVRYSKLGQDLNTAFKNLKAGDATAIAKLAPTTLIFGAWDSRDTQAKCPRIVASEIRAYDVYELRRSTTYRPPIIYKDLDLLEENYRDTVLSELGFLHNPATHKLGGLLVKGEIRRKSVLNLTTLRDVGGDDKLHHYLLGLALVAFTEAQPYNLRQGCLLVRDADKKPVVKLVNYDGSETEALFEPSEVLAYALNAAKEFGVDNHPKTVEFDPRAANDAIKERLEEKGGKAKKVGKKKPVVENSMSKSSKET
jgi:CRISPR-associated protein Csb1